MLKKHLVKILIGLSLAALGANVAWDISHDKLCAEGGGDWAPGDGFLDRLRGGHSSILPYCREGE